MKAIRIIAITSGAALLLLCVIGSQLDPQSTQQSTPVSTVSNSEDVHSSETVAVLLTRRLNTVLIQMGVAFPEVKTEKASNTTIALICDEADPSTEVWITGFRYEHEVNGIIKIEMGEFITYKGIVYGYNETAREIFPESKQERIPVKFDRALFRSWLTSGATQPPIQVTGCK